MICFTGLMTSLSSSNLVVGDTLRFECRRQDCYSYKFEVFVDTINADEPCEVTSCSLIDNAVLHCTISNIGPEYDGATIYCEATNLNAPTQNQIYIIFTYRVSILIYGERIYTMWL